MSDATVACWARVLHAVPRSKLLLKSATFTKAEVCRVTEARFAAHGIAADRLVLKPQNSSYLLHFQSYSEIDICLDPFPYNGTTTSCEAMWMGAPVLTVKGESFVARVGESLMRTVGLPEWIADDADDYVARATRLAGDLDALALTRSGLRARFAASPLGDAPRFARSFEAALLTLAAVMLASAGAGFWLRARANTRVVVR